MPNNYVKSVHYGLNNKGNKVIDSVKVCQIINGHLGIEQIWKRSEVIYAIEEQGQSFKTIFKRDGSYKLGFDVLVVEVDNEKYIRTDSNKRTADNLGEIEEF